MATEDAACIAGAAATTSHAAAFISRRLKHWHFLIEINDGFKCHPCAPAVCG